MTYGIQTEEDAIELIHRLKSKFDLKLLTWGEAEIKSVLNDTDSAGVLIFPARYHAQIIKEVKESSEWHHLPVADAAHDIWDVIRELVARIGESVVTLETELGRGPIITDIFSEAQIHTFHAYSKQSNQAVAEAMGPEVTAEQVQELRDYQYLEIERLREKLSL